MYRNVHESTEMYMNVLKVSQILICKIAVLEVKRRQAKVPKPSSPNDSSVEVTNKGFPSIKVYSVNLKKDDILGKINDVIFWRTTFIRPNGTRIEFEFIPRKDEVIILKTIERDKMSKMITKDFIYEHITRLMKEGYIDA